MLVTDGYVRLIACNVKVFVDWLAWWHLMATHSTHSYHSNESVERISKWIKSAMIMSNMQQHGEWTHSQQSTHWILWSKNDNEFFNRSNLSIVTSAIVSTAIERVHVIDYYAMNISIHWKSINKYKHVGRKKNTFNN